MVMMLATVKKERISEQMTLDLYHYASDLIKVNTMMIQIEYSPREKKIFILCSFSP